LVLCNGWRGSRIWGFTTVDGEILVRNLKGEFVQYSRVMRFDYEYQAMTGSNVYVEEDR
jgi:hypothetical protein